MLDWEYFPHIIGGAAFIGLLLFSIKLYRRLRKLEKNLFSYYRVLEQKTGILENTVAQISSAMPPDLNPELREKKFLSSLESLVQNFSVALNKSTQEQIVQQNDLWHEKFSALLRALGKTEKDLSLSRDPNINAAWTSIVELRQKSQLLFDDMREDGIFYRLQSLWLLGSLGANQGRHMEALRHFTAAFRLYKDTLPKLPLSKTLMWQIADDYLSSVKQAEPPRQADILEKFHISPTDITHIYTELDKFDAHPDTLQKLRSWAHTAIL